MSREVKNTDQKARGLLRRSIHHLGPYVLPRWPMLLVAAGALGMYAGMELLKPWPMAFLIDYLLVEKNFLPAWVTPGKTPGSALTQQDLFIMLIAVCAMVVVVALLSSTAAYFREYLLKRLGEEVAFDLRAGVFKHIQRLSLAFHDSSKIGDLITRVTNDITAVRNMATQSLLQLATAGVTIVGYLAVMFYINWQLALISMITLPMLAPTVWYFRRQIEMASKDRKKSEVEMSSLTQETMSSIRLVKAFGREGYQQKKFGRESSESVKAGLREAKLSAAYVRSVDIIVAIGTVAMVWFAVHQVWADALLPGKLIVFVAYQKGLYAPLRDIAKMTGRIAKGKVGLERVIEVLDMEPGVQDKPGAVKAPPLKGRVEFRDVGFEYLPGQPALVDASFVAEPGQIVALVGHSGAGKSTIMSLIPRLYDPVEGQVLIDGRDLRDFKMQSIRDQISFVLQDSVLLQTSILENVLYGRPEATQEEVEEALVAAKVDQFIDRLPDRFLTVVGARGATLSGGERQRVAIARAMVRRSPILLLDEPTTGLDVENELLVMQALENLMKGKTTFVISHKLSLIERADLILVVDGGRIVESGRHQQLLDHGGVYERMHTMVATRGEGMLGDGQADRPVLEAS